MLIVSVIAPSEEAGRTAAPGLGARGDILKADATELRRFLMREEGDWGEDLGVSGEVDFDPIGIMTLFFEEGESCIGFVVSGISKVDRVLFAEGHFLGMGWVWCLIYDTTPDWIRMARIGYDLGCRADRSDRSVVNFNCLDNPKNFDGWCRPGRE